MCSAVLSKRRRYIVYTPHYTTLPFPTLHTLLCHYLSHPMIPRLTYSIYTHSLNARLTLYCPLSLFLQYSLSLSPFLHFSLSLCPSLYPSRHMSHFFLPFFSSVTFSSVTFSSYPFSNYKLPSHSAISYFSSISYFLYFFI